MVRDKCRFMGAIELVCVSVILWDVNRRVSALSAGRKYCQASGGIMRKSASTACKRSQVFLLFRKLKSNIKDWH